MDFNSIINILYQYGLEEKGRNQGNNGHRILFSATIIILKNNRVVPTVPSSNFWEEDVVDLFF